MRVWMMAMMLVVLALAGCMDGSDAPNAPQEVTFDRGSERDERAPQTEERQTNGSGTAPPGMRRDDLPPGGPRRDEVWSDTYFCVGVGVVCPVNEHPFDVEERYGAFTVTLATEAPAVVCCNRLAVWLTAPNGLKVPGVGLAHLETYTGGEAVSFAVDDPDVLGLAGRWMVAVATVDVAATVVAYEARVAFTPHPDHASFSTGPPDVVSLDATHYMGADFPIEWARVDRVVPHGFAPLGFPYFRLLDAHRGLPEGTLASVLVAGMHYTGGAIDGTPLTAGDLVFALALVDPPAEHEHTAQEYVWLAAVTSDPLLAGALEGLGIPAASGDVQIDMDVIGAIRTGVVEVQGDPLDLRMDVRVEDVRPLLGSPENDQEIVLFGAVAREVAETMVWSLGRHKALPGDVAMEGIVGGLGAVDRHGMGGILWFGAGDAPSDDTGSWRYDRVDAERDAGASP